MDLVVFMELFLHYHVTQSVLKLVGQSSLKGGSNIDVTFQAINEGELLMQNFV